MRAQRRISSQGLALLQQEDRVEAALWRRVRLEGDAQARGELFARYEPLARAIAASEFAKRRDLGSELAEVRQLACEGLLQAIGSFDATLGVPFPAYARRRIRGNVADGLAKADERSAQFRFHQRAERDRLRSLQERTQAASDNPIGELGKLATLLAIGLMLEDPAIDPDSVPARDPGAYETLAWSEMQQRLADLLTLLDDREQFVIVQHYRNDVPFTQIAEILGLSKGRISQIHKAALLRLRAELERFR